MGTTRSNFEFMYLKMLIFSSSLLSRGFVISYSLYSSTENLPFCGAMVSFKVSFKVLRWIWIYGNGSLLGGQSRVKSIPD